MNNPATVSILERTNFLLATSLDEISMVLTGDRMGENYKRVEEVQTQILYLTEKISYYLSLTEA